MEDYNVFIILGIIVLFIIIVAVIISKSSQEESKDDTALYDLGNDEQYRNAIYKQISIDFKPCLQQLLQSLDNLNAKVLRANSEISQAQCDAMCDIFKTAERISAQINEYWNSTKFKKDFSYYIGLHYASHLLANSLKEEQQKIKEAFVECKRRQNILTAQIETAKRRQEKSHGEQRYRISREIGDLCKIHQNISKWKSYIGSLNAKYNERVTSQNMKTAKYRDYIAENFGARGQRWKERCHQRALARKGTAKNFV